MFALRDSRAYQLFVRMALLVTAIPALACPPIEIEDDTDPCGGPILCPSVHSTVGGDSDSKTGPIPVEGLFWKTAKSASGATATSSVIVKPTGDKVTAVVRQRLTPSATAASEGLAEIRLPLKVVGDPQDEITVRVRITRYVRPAVGATGSIEFFGPDGATLDLSAGEHKSMYETTYELNGGDSIPAVVFGAETIASPSSSGATEVETTAEVFPECSPACPGRCPGGGGGPLGPSQPVPPDCGGGGGGGPPPGPEDCPPKDGKENSGDPCGMQASESENDCEGQGTGPGLHIAFTTGQIYSQVPLFTTYAMGEVEWEFSLKYNTANSRNTPTYRGVRYPVGWGWRHTFQYEAEFVASALGHDGHCPAPAEFRFTDPTGRVEVFSFENSCYNLGSFGQTTTWNSDPSPGRGMSLQGWTEQVNGYWIPFFKLTDRYGNVFEFRPISWSDWNMQLQTITDRRGRVTRFFYDFEQDIHPSAVVSPHGRRVRFFYDSEDPANYDVCDNDGSINTPPQHLRKIEHPDGKVTLLEQNSDNELISILDPEQATQTGQPKQTFEYLPWTAPYNDDIHYISRETLKNGRIFEADYAPHEITLRAGTSTSTEVIARIRESGSAEIQYGHNPELEAGTVTYIDGEDHHWTIERDASTRMISRIAEDGATESWEFGSNGWLSKITDQNDNSTVQEWNPHGGAESVTDAELNVTTVTYSTEFPDKRVTRVAPGNRTWTFSYDDSVTGPSGSTGDLLSVTDPDNQTTTYAYETWAANVEVPCYVAAYGLPGRVKKITRTDRDSRVTVLEYDPRGNLIRITRDPSGLNLQTEFEYDNNPSDDDEPGMGRVVKRTILDADPEIPDVVTTWQYDAMGRVLFHKTGPPSGTQFVTEYKYDAHGLLIEVIDPDSKKVQFTYDARNRLEFIKVDPDDLNLQTKRVYDGNNRLVQVYSPNHFANGNSGYVTDFGYDVQGFLTSVIDPADADNVHHATTLWRDPAGNLVGLEREKAWGESNQDTFNVRYVYDVLNRRTQTIVDPTPDTTSPPRYPGRTGGLSITTTLEYTPTGTCGCSGATPGEGLVRKIIDPNGNVAYFHYDDLDRREKIVRKVGTDDGEAPDNVDDAVTWFEYDNEGNLTDFHGPEGEHTHFVYDGAGRRTNSQSYYDATNYLETVTTYTASDLLRSLSSPGGNQAKLTYDEYGRLVTVADRPTGTGSYAPTLTLEYEANGSLWKRTTAIAGQTVEFEYDAANRLKKQFDPLVESPTDLYTEYFYDANSNRTRVVDRLGTETKFVYDQRNRLIEAIENVDGADATANTSTHFEYNADAQIKIRDEDGNATHYKYDPAGRLAKAIYPDTGEVNFTYHAGGQLHLRTDQRGIVATHLYNDLNQLTARSYSIGASDEVFTYDRSGRLLTAKNDVAHLEFQYDLLGRLEAAEQAYVTSVSPLTLTSPYVTAIDYSVGPVNSTRLIHYPNGRSVTEMLDGRANLVGVTVPDPLNTSKVNGVTFQYDSANRRSGSRFGNAWEWDSSGAYAPGSLTNLLQTTLDYDLNNRLLEITHAKQASALTNLVNLEFAYDAEGNPLYKNDLITPERSELYQYDERYRLTGFRRGELSGLPSAPTIADPDLISDLEMPQTQTWPTLGNRGNWGDAIGDVGHTTTINGTTQTQRRRHNATNETERLEVSVSSTTKVAVNELEYDDAGNLIRVDLLGDMNCDGQVTAGDIGAFQQAILDPAAYQAAYPDCSISLGDVDGNGQVAVGDIGAFINAVSAAGGLQSAGYVYDAENRLVEVNDGLTSANDVFLEIAYDALGRRVLSIEHRNVEDPCGDDDPNYPVSTRHIYLGLTPIEEYQQADCPSPTPDVTWELAREFLWGTRFPEPLAMIDWTDAGNMPAGNDPATNGEWLYYLRDRLGSVVGLVAAGRQSASTSGTPAASEPQLVERYVYDPYGATVIESWNGSAFVRVDQSELGNPWMRTGQRFDAGVGLYHFVYRTYSPKLGRWLQRDPLGYVDGVSLYSYAKSQVSQLVDPLGLDDVNWDDEISNGGRRGVGNRPSNSGLLTPQEQERLQDLNDQFDQNAISAGAAVITFAVMGVMFAVPDPTDAFAATLAKYGFKLLQKAGKKLLEIVVDLGKGKTRCITKADLGDFEKAIKEHQQNVRGGGGGGGAGSPPNLTQTPRGGAPSPGPKRPGGPKPNRGGSGGAAAETFDNAEDAIGMDGINGIRRTGSERTGNQGLRDQGFTETHYYVSNSSGTQYTVHYNPTTRQFFGAHPSSSNP